MEKSQKMQMGQMGKKMQMGAQMAGVERCPLSGAAKGISTIEGAVMVVIGTEECSYYTKTSLDMGGRGDCCYSVVMDKQDVTFGFEEKVASALEELLEETKPKVLFLVTTCVPEIMGEDYQALAKEVEKNHKIPVHIIQTNHYSGKNGEYGFELVEKATGSTIQRDKMHKMSGNRNMERSMMGKLGQVAQRIKGKGQAGGGMSQEEMMEKMRQKTGGQMTEAEMRDKIEFRMNGGGRR